MATTTAPLFKKTEAPKGVIQTVRMDPRIRITINGQALLIPDMCVVISR